MRALERCPQPRHLRDAQPLDEQDGDRQRDSDREGGIEDARRRVGRETEHPAPRRHAARRDEGDTCSRCSGPPRDRTPQQQHAHGQQEHEHSAHELQQRIRQIDRR